MTCPTCGAEIPENAISCTFCGTAFEYYTPAAPVPPVQPAYNPVTPAPEVKLLGPWGYFGLQLLFAIPLVGFILLIVFSFDNSNLNRRNFARSYWCGLLLSVIIAIVLTVVILATGAGAAIMSQLP